MKPHPARRCRAVSGAVRAGCRLGPWLGTVLCLLAALLRIELRVDALWPAAGCWCQLANTGSWLGEYKAQPPVRTGRAAAEDLCGGLAPAAQSGTAQPAAAS